MEYSAREKFQKSFYDTIRKKYENAKKELSEGNGCCTKYGNVKWKSLSPSIAYIFIMTDGVLFEYINQCVNNGYATQSEISGIFGMKSHVMNSRITIAHDEKLRIYWSNLIDKMAKTYPPANPSFLNAKKTLENGDIVECGSVLAVYKHASHGFSKDQICNIMHFNPSSWYEFPVLLQNYEQGMIEFLSGKSDKNIDAITVSFITNDYFIETVIPAIKLEAFEHKVMLVKKKYSIKQELDDEGKPTGKEIKVLKSEDWEEKLVLGNKEMRDIAVRLSSGNLLNQINIDQDKKREAVKAIPMHKSEFTTERGTFKQPVEDLEYEPIK